MSEKGGLSFKGGSLHGGFDGFGGSGKHLAPPFACPTKYRTKRQTVDSFGSRGGFGRDG